MKTAVIYARYSSDSQSEQSIDGQLHVCKDYAKTNQIIILDTYIDRAMTGRNDNRPAFQQMIKDSKKRKWDYVLVYKFDRFSRNKYETAIHKKTLKDNGIKLVSATEYLPDTPERIIIESMFEGYAEYYSAELSQKVSRGMRESRLKGLFTGGIIAYGYRVEDKKVYIEESEAEVVKQIYLMYYHGKTKEEIKKYFNNKGIYNRGNPFVLNTITRILTDKKYMGKYECHGEIFEKVYPAIVTEELYYKVQDTRKENRHTSGSLDTHYLLKRKLICGYCGEQITSEGGRTKKGKLVRYYNCKGRINHNGCKKKLIQKEILETFVIKVIIDELNNKTNRKFIIDNLIKMQDDYYKDDIQLKMLIKEQKRIKNSIENLLKAIENGVITDSTLERLKDNEEKKKLLDEQILIEQNKNSIKLTKEDIEKYLDESLQLEMQAVIKVLVDKIILYDDRMDITFNSPIKKSPTNEGFSFCKKKLNMMTNKPFSNQIEKKSMQINLKF